MKRIVLSAVILSASLWAQTVQSKPAATTTPATPAQSVAVIDTTVGKLTCTLFPDKAPIGVANFIGLARGTKDWTNPVTHEKKHHVPLYDGTIFHRVIPNFMIQGGDPAGTGMGDGGFKFRNETSPDLLFDRPGRLAYANSGPDTNGTQFFITEMGYPSLNGNYTIFGQCDDATVELVKQIARRGRDSNDRPYEPVKITHITITGDAPAKAMPAAAKPSTATKKATPAQ